MPLAGSEGEEGAGSGDAGPLTCVGLHVLQQVVVELELDPTGAAGVGFWEGEMKSPYQGQKTPDTLELGTQTHCGSGCWSLTSEGERKACR